MRGGSHFRFFGYFFIMELQFAATLFAIAFSVIVPLLYWHLRLAISLLLIFDLVDVTRKFFATTNDHFSRREFHKLLFHLIKVGFWVPYWNLQWSLSSRIFVALVCIVPLLLDDIWDFFFIQTQIRTGFLFPIFFSHHDQRKAPRHNVSVLSFSRLSKSQIEWAPPSPLRRNASSSKSDFQKLRQSDCD